MVRFDLPLSPDGVRHQLADGGSIVLRPIRPTDADELRQGFARLSERSRFLRFFTPMQQLPEPWVKRLSEIDHQTHRAWVAYDPDGDAPPPGLGVGVARLIEVDGRPTTAEAAIAVTDDYHGRGIGRALLEVLGGTAVIAGYDSVIMTVLLENHAMLELARSLGPVRSTIRDGATLDIEVGLEGATDDAVIEGALYDLLRLAARHQGES